MITKSSPKQAGNTALHALLTIVVLGIIGFVGWRIAERHKTPTVIKTAATTLPASSSNPSASTTISPGTDNGSLNSDLSSISSSLNQSSQGSNSANTAINDQQYEITVPTNKNHGPASFQA